METLKAENLVKTFPISEKQRKSLGIKDKRKTAVNGVSFTAKSGEVLGLLGPNGAGKTTTMRMLTTLISPDSGEIYYNDKSVRENPTAIRQEFAFLTADLKLDMKSTANQMFDFFAQLYHIEESVAKARKAELFETFGIGAFADTMIRKLSQGQRQKVSLAISVIHDPRFIIFDEPTNGLDIISARDVRDFILDMKAKGKCVIISTHLFDLVERVCDRAAMIIDGRIVLDDTIANLTKDQSLEDAFYDIYTQFHKEA